MEKSAQTIWHAMRNTLASFRKVMKNAINVEIICSKNMTESFLGHVIGGIEDELSQHVMECRPQIYKYGRC